MGVTEAGGILDRQIVGVSGARYVVEAQAFWDNKKETNIRVMASSETAERGRFILSRAILLKHRTAALSVNDVW